MREPMSLLEQVNGFNNSNRQRLIIDRTVRPRLPVYSSFNPVDDNHRELKTLSFDVYASKHPITTRKSMIPYSERHRLDEILLPSLVKDINREENPRRRRRKRPPYRKSLFHSYSPNATRADLPRLLARGTKSESQTEVSIITRDDDTIFKFQRHRAPPPSPSDNEIEHLLYEIQDSNQPRPCSRRSPIEKEEHVPFRLPVLHRSARFCRTPSDLPAKNIRSTLSNYLQKYY